MNFWSKKKNPLVLPPDYASLPEPGVLDEKDIEEDDSSDVEKLILNVEKNSENNDSMPSGSSIEEFVLKKINEN